MECGTGTRRSAYPVRRMALRGRARWRHGPVTVACRARGRVEQWVTCCGRRRRTYVSGPGSAPTCAGCGSTAGLDFADYDALWRWSVDRPGRRSGARSGTTSRSIGAHPADRDAGRAGMPGARWFPGAHAQLRRARAADARAGRRRPGGDRPLADPPAGHAHRRRAARPGPPGAGRAAPARRRPPGTGWRRTPRTSPRRSCCCWPPPASARSSPSCAPEFGTRSVTDRWRQIEPKVLVAVDGYRYGDKPVDRRAEVAAIRAALPSLRHTVSICRTSTRRPARRRARWAGPSWPRPPTSR